MPPFSISPRNQSLYNHFLPPLSFWVKLSNVFASTETTEYFASFPSGGIPKEVCFWDWGDGFTVIARLFPLQIISDNILFGLN
jgi:hypothetical protein